ncbi:MAG: methyltransferase [Chloroflexi bacterium]|nr:methyltransferase [Chloroflexota bacterium]
MPGASPEERSALAAVGGIAAALVGERVSRWPIDLRRWASAAPKPPQDLIDGAKRKLEADEDVLAALYEGIVSGRNRRRLGTFFTPPLVVEFMLERAEHALGQPAIVIDPGAGVGAFSLAAKRRWPHAEVVAVDINVVTLGLLGARPGADVTLVLDDFLVWAAGANVPARQPRLWIGNPPYTRHQELAPAVKDAASVAAGHLVSSGLAGLSAYFLAVTLRALAPSDALCFLLPGSWTAARYGRPLREALRDLTDRPVALVGFGSEVDVFPGTRVTAMVLVVGPACTGAPQSLTTATASLDPSGVTVGHPVLRDRRDGAIEDLGGWLWPRQQSGYSDHVLLGDIARVRRGVATGANDYFLLTATEKAALPEAATVRAIRRLRHLDGDRLSSEAHEGLAALGEKCWLLRIDDSGLIKDPALQEWLQRATNSGVPQRYLASRRNPWYLVEAVVPPDVILSPMGKRRMRAVVNEAEVIPSNALYGVYLEDKADAQRIVEWLNRPEGQIALLERARAYGAGLFKLEPKDVLALRIPRSILADGGVRPDRPVGGRNSAARHPSDVEAGRKSERARREVPRR